MPCCLLFDVRQQIHDDNPTSLAVGHDYTDNDEVTTMSHCPHTELCVDVVEVPESSLMKRNEKGGSCWMFNDVLILEYVWTMLDLDFKGRWPFVQHVFLAFYCHDMFRCILIVRFSDVFGMLKVIVICNLELANNQLAPKLLCRLSSKNSFTPSLLGFWVVELQGKKPCGTFSPNTTSTT